MKNNMTATKRAAFLGLATALSLLLSYVEVLMPPLYAAVPGIKLGLPNMAILYLLYSTDVRYAALVSLTRVAISSLLFGNVMSLSYSLAGALLSLSVMWLLKKTKLWMHLDARKFRCWYHPRLSKLGSMYQMQR